MDKQKAEQWMVETCLIFLKEWKEEKESENLIPTVELLIEELEEQVDPKADDISGATPGMDNDR